MSTGLPLVRAKFLLSPISDSGRVGEGRWQCFSPGELTKDLGPTPLNLINSAWRVLSSQTPRASSCIVFVISLYRAQSPPHPARSKGLAMCRSDRWSATFLPLTPSLAFLSTGFEVQTIVQLRNFLQLHFISTGLCCCFHIPVTFDHANFPCATKPPAITVSLPFFPSKFNSKKTTTMACLMTRI